MLRLNFELTVRVQTAPVLVTADGRYQLFVNGVRIGRGPARSSSTQGVLDSYDLAPWLKTGRNVIAVLAHSYGRNMAWYEIPGWDAARAFGCGGFFLQGEADNVCLDTGSAWRCKLAQTWEREVPANSLGYSEIYDARQLAIDWTETNYDDGDWDDAEILRLTGRNNSGDVVPFHTLSLRDIPAQREGPLRRALPITCFEVVIGTETSDIAQRMNSEQPLPLDQCMVSDGMSSIGTVAGRGVSVVYDFGEVVAGYIGFDLDCAEGAMVDYYSGEQLLPDGRVRNYNGIPGFESPMAHRFITQAGSQKFERFEWSGLRYIQVTYWNCDTRFRVHAITVNQTGYPVEDRGNFECSDAVLNQIWIAGARTLRLCMHDAYVDCPSREQRQWMDAYLDARINYAVYGDTKLAARLIRQIAASQRPEGLTTMAAPGDFALAGFTNIPDFCLYWILSIGDYLTFADDKALVEEVYPNVARALQWFGHFVNDDGLLTDVPLWVFVEWAETDKKGQVTALNALYVGALRDAARIAHTAGHARGAIQYHALADRVSNGINTLLWDARRGVYVDARRNGKQSERISQQSNAAVIAWQVAPQERRATIFEVILDERRLVLTHGLGREGQITSFDESNDVVMAQSFFSHFLHRAMRLDGRYQAMLDNTRKRWGALLTEGQSTFPETWQIEPITSLCHAWSATPSFDLSTDILGVEPIADGFRRLRVAPQCCDLEWARGSFPTPYGDVLVAWQRTTTEDISLSVTVPVGCIAEIQCPGSSEVHCVVEGCYQFINGEIQNEIVSNV